MARPSSKSKIKLNSKSKNWHGNNISTDDDRLNIIIGTGVNRFWCPKRKTPVPSGLGTRN
jgi:hypothetical protein